MNTVRNPLRIALARAGYLPVGTWIKLPTPEATELAALAGFDFVVIDLEHSPITVESASTHIALARAHGMAVIVRVPTVGSGLIQRVLDAGADGIMLPHVESVDEARALVDAARFPPLGQRGMGPTSRAGQWGALPREEYLRYGRDEVFIIAQIESPRAAARIARIGAVEGIDSVLIGAVDLGLAATAESAPVDVSAVIREAAASARAAGIPVGDAGAGTADAVATSLELGFDYTILSNDASLLGWAMRKTVTTARALEPSLVR